MNDPSDADPLAEIIAMATTLQGMELRESDEVRIERVMVEFRRAYNMALNKKLF